MEPKKLKKIKSKNCVKEIRKWKIYKFDGKPSRETIISKDDIINLKIVLESVKTEEDFINFLLNF
jgi:hypothetical protein